jgi:hypothetical protein
MVRQAWLQMVRKESASLMVLIKPRGATHAILTTAEGKRAVVEVADLDTLRGTEGTLQWMRLAAKSREILGATKFDGKIDEIKNDYQRRSGNK